jgi:hypothetical protein
MGNRLPIEELRAAAALVVAAVCLLCLSGCGLLYYEPMIDAVENERGEVILADTPKMWRQWKEVVDLRISWEISGDDPPMGKASWPEFWRELIRRNRSGGRENPERYVDYIIVSRREAGLPPLGGE